MTHGPHRAWWAPSPEWQHAIVTEAPLSEHRRRVEAMLHERGHLEMSWGPWIGWLAEKYWRGDWTRQVQQAILTTLIGAGIAEPPYFHPTIPCGYRVDQTESYNPETEGLK